MNFDLPYYLCIITFIYSIFSLKSKKFFKNTCITNYSMITCEWVWTTYGPPCIVQWRGKRCEKLFLFCYGFFQGEIFWLTFRTLSCILHESVCGSLIYINLSSINLRQAIANLVLRLSFKQVATTNYVEPG